MYRTRRSFIVVLTILTTVSIVGLIVTPAGAGVGPNPPGASVPGSKPDLVYGTPPVPAFHFVEDPAVIEGDLGDVAILTFELVSTHPVVYDTVFQALTYPEPHAATPWVDYIPKNELITIPAGGTTAYFEVEVLGDHLPEKNESVRVHAYLQGRNVVGPQAYGWIIDDDPDVAYSLADAQQYEGDRGTYATLSFELTASEPLGHDVTFLAHTQTGSATSDDFVALTYAPVVLPAGATSVAVTVQIRGDLVVENNETLTLQLYRLDPANTWHLLQATGTILDDDTPRAS
jgi:hypothetical protein